MNCDAVVQPDGTFVDGVDTDPADVPGTGGSDEPAQPFSCFCTESLSCGTRSGATRVTGMPRMAREAAASQPMNPAPITTAESASTLPVRSRFASDNDLNRYARSPPGTGSGVGAEPHARYQRGVRVTLFVDDDGPGSKIDVRDPCAHELDAMLGIPLLRMQRDVVCVSAEELLAQRRPRVRRVLVHGENPDGRLGVAAPEGLCGPDAGRPAADDDQRLAHRSGIPTLGGRHTGRPAAAK